MALLKVLACFLLATVALAEVEDDGQYDPAKYEAPFMHVEADEGATESTDSAEPVKSESPVESPVQPAESPVQPAESPVQPAESPVQPALSPVQPEESPLKSAVSPVKSAESPVKPVEERLSEVMPSFPAGTSPLAAAPFPPVSPLVPFPLSSLSQQQPLFPFVPQQISPFVAQQIPQEVAPFIYSGPQVLRIAAQAFPTVAA